MRKIPIILLVLLSVPVQRACAGKWMEECCCDPIGSELNEEILYKHWNAERLSESDNTAIPKSIWTLHSYLKMFDTAVMKQWLYCWPVQINSILWLVVVISVSWSFAYLMWFSTPVVSSSVWTWERTSSTNNDQLIKKHWLSKNEEEQLVKTLVKKKCTTNVNLRCTTSTPKCILKTCNINKIKVH